MSLERTYTKQPIPITEKVKTLSPICEGQLYAHEVLILCYAHKYTTGTNSYEGFWQYKYGITDMDAQIKSLHERGFLRIGSLEDAMNTATLPTLKNIAKQSGLKVSGRKNDIIQRILSAVDDNSLNTLFLDKPYFLTELGQYVINKENYMKYIHNQPDSNINIWNFSEMAHEFPSLPYTEILQRYYSKQAENHLRQKQYGLYRNCIFHTAELDMEDEHFENALIHFFEVTYYDLSGLSNFSDSSRLNKDASQQLFSYEYSFAKIAPGILSKIVHCKEKLNISEGELKEKMIAALFGIELPFQIFTLEECADILLLEMHQDRIKIENIYRTAENRYKINHPQKQNTIIKEQASYGGMSFHEYKEYIQNKISEEVAAKDNTFDPEFEEILNCRIEKLDDISKMAFQQVLDNIKSDDVLSIKDRLLLTIEALERSQQYHEKTSATEES